MNRRLRLAIATAFAGCGVYLLLKPDPETQRGAASPGEAQALRTLSLIDPEAAEEAVMKRKASTE